MLRNSAGARNPLSHASGHLVILHSSSSWFLFWAEWTATPQTENNHALNHSLSLDRVKATWLKRLRAHTPLIREDQVPHGFSFAAVRAGLKASGNPDLACAVADRPAIAAAMFTSNKVIAAPLIVGQRHLHRGQHQLRVVLVNAGNANCATGEAGVTAAQQCCVRAAAIFGCEPHSVFPSSTGIIGVPLPVDKLTAALPALHAGLGSSASHLEQMAGAIMTTDTRSKFAAASFEVRGVTVRVAGIAKGAGMIHPQLQSAPAAPHATMLVYLFTDAVLEPDAASDLLYHAVESTFNRISIDGDTSTNDTVLLLASGASGVNIQGHSHATATPVEDPSRLHFFRAAIRLLIPCQANCGGRGRH